MSMECDKCKYLFDNTNTIYELDDADYIRIRMCRIGNIAYPKRCSYIESDKDIENMSICYNCKHWTGCGDFGLSCAKDYYNCSSNGFDKACEKFEKW